MSKPATNEINKSLRLCEVLEEEYNHLHEIVPSAYEVNEQQAFLEKVKIRNTAELISGLKKWLDHDAAGMIPTPNEKRYKELADWLKAYQKNWQQELSMSTLPAKLSEVNRDQFQKIIEWVLEKKLTQNLSVEERWMQDGALRPYTRGLLKYYNKKKPYEKDVNTEQARQTPRLQEFQNRMPKWAQSEVALPEEQQLLNRLLLEDTYVGYIHRVDDLRLGKIFKRMYGSYQTALCFSGGGIRSATFGLGVLQGLAKHNLLDKFTYLSTVSGGGYLGGWLSAWIHHEGLSEVISKLGTQYDTPLEPEAVPVRHLRRYSNYLSPVLGLFSADTWTLIAIYIRNLLLLWLVIIPLLAAFTGLPWIAISIAELNLKNSPASVPIMVSLAALFTITGTCFIHTYRPESERKPEKEQEFASKRNQEAFLWRCLLPLCLAILSWSLAWRWFENADRSLPYFLSKIRDSFEFNKKTGLSLFSYGTGIIVLGTTAAHVCGWLVSLLFRKTRTQKLAEFAAVILAGALAGFFLVMTSKLLRMNYYAATDHLIPIRYTCLAVPGFLISLLLAGFLFEGLVSFFTVDSQREWTARYSAWLLIVALGWLAVSSLVLYGPLFSQLIAEKIGILPTTGVGIGSWILTALLGQSSKTTGEGEGTGSRKENHEKRSLSRLLPFLTLPVIALVASIALFIGLSFLDMVIMRYLGLKLGHDISSLLTFEVPFFAEINPVVPTFTCVLLVGIGLIFGYTVNTNYFSLHALYRMRLIRAYLSASRPTGERQPDPFTGFDEKDNLQMGCLIPKKTPEDTSSSSKSESKKPFHIVNIALNLVAGRNLAWQERKAESFTVSPLHAGALYLGYRNTYLKEGIGCPYPEKNKNYYGGPHGISLGTAMTISGAAASPNQGYHSSPVIGFLMTLLNVRLGWWLGNPGPAGDTTFNQSAPSLAIKPIFDEMIGNTDDINKYVYLSDGGHFENLGLYEMVLRRNRVILLSDAGCDESCTLEDLGNAIRKIRIDHGISIDFPLGFNIYSRNHKNPITEPGKYLAIGRIRYSESVYKGYNDSTDQPSSPKLPIETSDYIRKKFAYGDGILLYVKPAFYGNEPRDIFNYASANKAFPHESTGDQFFSESQFESYRALGENCIENIEIDLKTELKLSLADFFMEGNWKKCIDQLNEQIKKTKP